MPLEANQPAPEFTLLDETGIEQHYRLIGENGLSCIFIQKTTPLVAQPRHVAFGMGMGNMPVREW